jgi:dTDP-glucose pyrophosphorylase
MNILIPMAGAGSRFSEAGYTVSKPAIPTYDKRTGKQLPMVVCATLDLPGVEKDGSNVIYIDRDFHAADGTQKAISDCFPKARFITLDYLTEGQACTCLLAEKLIDNDDELLIAGCDNGMEINADKYEKYCSESDVLVFTYRHNEAVLANPNAYGWMKVDEHDNIVGTSIKKSISDTPMEDHAVVATFWFRRGSIFVEAAKKMIAENDRINNEFYVDQVAKHVLELGYKAKVFEIDRYIGWGTPADYELYQKTFEYWNGFYKKEMQRMTGD